MSRTSWSLPRVTTYGRAASTDIDEETEQNPLNPYAESKVA